MKVRVTFDSSRLEESLRDYRRGSRRSNSVLVRQQMKLLVRDIVKITPPGHVDSPLDADTGERSNVVVTQAAARRAGEARIRKELRGLMRASNSPKSDSARDVHRRFRLQSTGRVSGKPRSGRARIPVRGLPEEIKTTLAKVGLLRAGWNAAASRLGLKMPAWIARHGSSRGAIRIRERIDDVGIVAFNRVAFVGQIRGFARRLQWAADNRALQLAKQVEFNQQRQARKAGFKS